jgi:hypothetical protein
MGRLADASKQVILPTERQTKDPRVSRGNDFRFTSWLYIIIIIITVYKIKKKFGVYILKMLLLQ